MYMAFVFLPFALRRTTQRKKLNSLGLVGNLSHIACAHLSHLGLRISQWGYT